MKSRVSGLPPSRINRFPSLALIVLFPLVSLKGAVVETTMPSPLTATKPSVGSIRNGRVVPRTGVTLSKVISQEGFWVGHDRAPTPAVPLDACNRWPTFAPSLKPAMERYFVAVEALSTVLMRAFALALGLAPDAISTLFKRPLSRLKLNHYPPQWDVRDEHHIGVVPHADSGGFTILWQDHHGGLEVATKDGHWVVAPPLDGAFVINLGNVMQIWTDGYFASTPHRVINRAGTDRYSIPFFVNPSHDASIGPLNGSAEAGPGYGDYQLDIWRHTFPIAYPAAAC